MAAAAEVSASVRRSRNAGSSSVSAASPTTAEQPSLAARSARSRSAANVPHAAPVEARADVQLGVAPRGPRREQRPIGRRPLAGQRRGIEHRHSIADREQFARRLAELGRHLRPADDRRVVGGLRRPGARPPPRGTRRRPAEPARSPPRAWPRPAPRRARPAGCPGGRRGSRRGRGVGRRRMLPGRRRRGARRWPGRCDERPRRPRPPRARSPRPRPRGEGRPPWRAGPSTWRRRARPRDRRRWRRAPGGRPRRGRAARRRCARARCNSARAAATAPVAATSARPARSRSSETWCSGRASTSWRHSGHGAPTSSRPANPAAPARCCTSSRRHRASVSAASASAAAAVSGATARCRAGRSRRGRLGSGVPFRSTRPQAQPVFDADGVRTSVPGLPRVVVRGAPASGLRIEGRLRRGDVVGRPSRHLAPLLGGGEVSPRGVVLGDGGGRVPATLQLTAALRQVGRRRRRPRRRRDGAPGPRLSAASVSWTSSSDAPARRSSSATPRGGRTAATRASCASTSDRRRSRVGQFGVHRRQPAEGLDERQTDVVHDLQVGHEAGTVLVGQLAARPPSRSGRRASTWLRSGGGPLPCRARRCAGTSPGRAAGATSSGGRRGWSCRKSAKRPWGSTTVRLNWSTSRPSRRPTSVDIERASAARTSSPRSSRASFVVAPLAVRWTSRTAV